MKELQLPEKYNKNLKFLKNKSSAFSGSCNSFTSPQLFMIIFSYHVPMMVQDNI